jgi:NAD(P)-dependent dehydrogenase (short-subunit alcohol dehydrogenase family)
VLSKASATVIVGARDVEKAKVNVAQMRNVEVIPLDLASPGSIDRFAGEFLAKHI